MLFPPCRRRRKRSAGRCRSEFVDHKQAQPALRRVGWAFFRFTRKEDNMTTLKASANGAVPLEAPPGTPLLGEVITWNAGGVKVKHTALVEALRDAGLDEKVARELAPRHAFTRACRKLGEKRI